MILWGMGISQHIHGTDNARCLIALSLMTGQIGRPGTGLHPLARTEQRAGRLGRRTHSDDVSGLSARRQSKAARARFAKAWGVPTSKLDDKPGLTVVEVIKDILAGNVKGMYIMGENPAMSDPDADHAREALAKLDMLVVQDIFLTETAYLADVILAGLIVRREDRHIHQHRSIRAARTPGAQSSRQGAAGSGDHHRSGAPARALAGPMARARRRWRRCSMRCATPCRASAALPGSGCRRKTASPIPARRKAIPATRWCSSKVLPDAHRQGEVRARRHHSGR